MEQVRSIKPFVTDIVRTSKHRVKVLINDIGTNCSVLGFTVWVKAAPFPSIHAGHI